MRTFRVILSVPAETAVQAVDRTVNALGPLAKCFQCRHAIDTETVNNRVAANVFGRLDHALSLMEGGDDASARRELVALLRFFPPTRRRHARRVSNAGGSRR